ncbi:unnamed protein product [Caenorhabditis bovis]|uniref:Spindle assembly abnormal protein 6 N-terminal domain-containing protein n=1 Tax=Caenorhabditis bovis TaxID=2654633 RepID=A0A8S1F7T0_9PELO|nr:unnamed protein product [Caenorhabditis bovis]
MSEFASISTRSSALFNQPLVASLQQSLRTNQSEYKAYRAKVNLKITEQRNETTGEKELRFEISRSDDFEFLFAEVLNNDKYQKLSREHDLTVDFEAFPRAIIQKLLSKNIATDDSGEAGNMGPHSFADGKPTEIKLVLDADKRVCSFELFSKTPISKGRIFALKMSAVRGDQLTAHLLTICSSQMKKLEHLRHLTSEHNELSEKFDKTRRELDELRHLEEKNKQDLDRIEELESELELVKEERQNLVILAEEKDELMEEIRQETEDARKQVEEMTEELQIMDTIIREEQDQSDRLRKEKEALRRENSELRKENCELLKDVEKSKHVVKKYLNNKCGDGSQQSVDMRKLKELEADLKEKDGLVLTLTETIATLRKELEDERKKCKEIEENAEQFRKANVEMNEKLQLYRNNRTSTLINGSNYMSPLLNGSAVPNNLTPSSVLRGTPAYKAVFPSSSSLNNTPLGGYANVMRSTTPGVFNQTSPYGNQLVPTTPTVLRNTTNLTNDTTTSTTTPILMNSTTTTPTNPANRFGTLQPTVTFNT